MRHAERLEGHVWFVPGNLRGFEAKAIRCTQNLAPDYSELKSLASPKQIVYRR